MIGTGNVQLTQKERNVVYISTLTGRILGFGPEGMRFHATEGYRSVVLYHARDIDRWADLYRKQEKEDAESEDFRRTEREAPIRNAIRQGLLARRSVVDANNRAFIDVNLRLMDQREERAKKRKQQAFLLCEAKEGKIEQEDLALESPAFRSTMPVD